METEGEINNKDLLKQENKEITRICWEKKIGKYEVHCATGRKADIKDILGQEDKERPKTY